MSLGQVGAGPIGVSGYSGRSGYSGYSGFSGTNGSVTGSGTVNTLPKFTPNGTTLGDSRISDDGSSIVLNQDSNGIIVTPANGEIAMGDFGSISDTYIDINYTAGTENIEIQSKKIISIGDKEGNQNSTLLEILDTPKTITATAGTESIAVDGVAHSVAIEAAANLYFNVASASNDWHIGDVNDSNLASVLGNPSTGTITQTAATSIGLATPQVKLNFTTDTTATPTINTPVGIVRIAGAASTVTVTVTGMTSSWAVFATVRTNDTTLKTVSANPGSGSFVLTGNAAATGNTDIQVWIVAPN